MASPKWQLTVCGINYKTGSIEDREPIQIERDRLKKANTAFNEMPDIMESLVLSTCNRIEFYMVSSRTSQPYEMVSRFYNDFQNIVITGMQEKFYTHRGRAAAEHLFRVAAGIDSMVLGENQILGQTKEAYSFACLAKSAGKIIHRLLHQAFRAGKLIRTETEMGKGACSVSSAATELIKIKLKGFDTPGILFVGANQMVTLAASNLDRLEQRKFHFINRTPEKAERLAIKYNCPASGLDQLEKLLAESDVVITCTGATEPIITSSMLSRVSENHPDKKLLLMDMAIPRDIENDHGAFPNFQIYNLEDVKGFVKDQQKKRERAIPEAEEIIDRRLAEFMYWLNLVRREGLYDGDYNKLEKIRQEEMGPLIDKLPPELQNKFNKATRKFTGRIFHLLSDKQFTNDKSGTNNAK